MTTRLEQAFTEASNSHRRNKMPWQIGCLLNSAQKKKWDRLVTNSQEELSKLASEALAEYHNKYRH